MAKKFETQLIDTEFFIAQDESGNLHCYDRDPLRTPDREGARIDLLKAIVDQFGKPDIANPIVIKVKGARLDRCKPFDAGMPERIRGGLAAHFEDFEGTCMEIVGRRWANKDFPLTALIIREDGLTDGYRLYSNKGECEDGVASHRLVVVDGAIPYAQNEG